MPVDGIGDYRKSDEKKILQRPRESVNTEKEIESALVSSHSKEEIRLCISDSPL